MLTFVSIQFPRIPGHETIGKIVAVGEGEGKWKVGDVVGGPWHGQHDGVCKACNRGLFQMCENELVNGVSRDGGCELLLQCRPAGCQSSERNHSLTFNLVAEYTILRSEATVRIPPGADPVQYAPLLCAGVTVFNGIRKMNITHGDIVAVQGLGGLGHLAVQYARKMGYRTVAISTSDKKKDFAMELGANDFIDTSKESAADALQKMGGAGLIVVTAPNPEVMGPLVNGLGPLGKLLILARKFDISMRSYMVLTRQSSCWRRSDQYGSTDSWR